MKTEARKLPLIIGLAFLSWISAAIAGDGKFSPASLTLGFVYSGSIIVVSYLREKQYIKSRWLVLMFWIWPFIVVLILHLL